MNDTMSLESMKDAANLSESKDINDLSEELLNAWLCLSAVVRNERLVQTMTFREIFICNILYQQGTVGGKTVTATDIVLRTGMLKSQANKVLCALEQRNFILRTRCHTDKRHIHIQLTDMGIKAYLTEHQQILDLLAQLVLKMGTDTTTDFIGHLNTAACVMKDLTGYNN